MYHIQWVINWHNIIIIIDVTVLLCWIPTVFNINGCIRSDAIKLGYGVACAQTESSKVDIVSSFTLNLIFLTCLRVIIAWMRHQLYIVGVLVVSSIRRRITACNIRRYILNLATTLTRRIIWTGVLLSHLPQSLDSSFPDAIRVILQAVVTWVLHVVLMRVINV